MSRTLFAHRPRQPGSAAERQDVGWMGDVISSDLSSSTIDPVAITGIVLILGIFLALPMVAAALATKRLWRTHLTMSIGIGGFVSAAVTWCLFTVVLDRLTLASRATDNGESVPIDAVHRAGPVIVILGFMLGAGCVFLCARRSRRYRS